MYTADYTVTPIDPPDGLRSIFLCQTVLERFIIEKYGTKQIVDLSLPFCTTFIKELQINSNMDTSYGP